MSAANPPLSRLPTGATAGARARVVPRRLIGLAVGGGLAAIAGFVAAWASPRGPDATPVALLWVAGLAGVGLIAGLVAHARWALLVVPVVFSIAFEIGRAGTDGPTVDAIHLDTTYGIIAFVVGRGVTLILAIPALILGILSGQALGAHLRPEVGSARPGRIRWAATFGVGFVVVSLVALLAGPPTTAPILGADGQPVAGSVAELTTLHIGGHDQALMIRGRDVDAPVLLHLAGGPGGTDLGAMRADTGLESAFVVVTWEQRGAGKSYAALDPADTLTPEGMVADTIELSERLRERFDEERIYLTGNSWGSTLGVLAAQQRPDLYRAFVGTGQMVSQRETDIRFWEDTLAWAESTGRTDLVETLLANGPPPYADVLAYEAALSHEHDWNPYPEFDNDRELPATLFVPENDTMDRINGLRAFLDTFSVLYPQLQDIDFRRDVPRLDVPVTLVQGTHEARGRMELAREWYALLDAPAKTWVEFEGSGHRPSFEEPARFVEVMRAVVAATDAG